MSQPADPEDPDGGVLEHGTDSAGVPWEGRAFQPNPHAGDDGSAPEAFLVALAAFRTGGDYLVYSGLDPWDVTPELSRRARGVPAWAALRSLGRSGVAALLDRLHANALAMAAGLREIPGVEVVNDVDYTQVMFRLGDDEATRALIAKERERASVPGRWFSVGRGR